MERRRANPDEIVLRAQAADHILVCVGSSPASADLVRAAARMAAELRARWTAAWVETAARRPSSEEDRGRVAQHLRLAEELGAQVTTLSGHRPADEILAYARANNVTRILLGKPTHPRWRDTLFGSLVDEVVRGSGDIDVHVIRGDVAEPQRARPARAVSPIRWAHYGWSAVVVAGATSIAFAMFRRFDLANLVMVYLLGIVFVAYRFGRGPAIFVSALSVAAFDFCFVPPYLTLTVVDLTHVVTFAIMLLVGLVVSGLTERVRQQAADARLRAQRISALYALTRELAGSADIAEIAQVAVRHMTAGFDGKAFVLLPNSARNLVPAPPSAAAIELDEQEQAVAAWAFEHGAPAGLATSSLPVHGGGSAPTPPGSRALYLPLQARSRTLGVLGVLPADPGRLLDAEQRQILEAFCQPIAMAIERARLADEAQAAHLRAEREELLSSLLSSVSHDLRTPLAAITGAASTLLEDDAAAPSMHRDLLQTIFEEADRLNRLVGNLLDMTRLEAGGLRVRKEWMPLEEIVGSALNRLDAVLRGREVRVQLPPDLVLVHVDGSLMLQVFINLLENAAKYTPAEGAIEIHARAEADAVLVEVADRGPGLPPGSEARLFEKFFRAPPEGAPGGTGLGLAICRGIVRAHGGTIVAENRPGGGARFLIRLPLEGAPPSVPIESGAR
jgi:two-component system, OmpR family, sensor histidine kinase KdpD